MVGPDLGRGAAVYAFALRDLMKPQTARTISDPTIAIDHV